MPRGVSWWHVAGDAAALLAAYSMAHVLRFQCGIVSAPLGFIPFAQWFGLTLLALPLWLLIAALHGLYYTRLRQSFTAELSALTHTAAEGLLATILLTFSFRGLPDSRLALIFAVGLAWCLLVGWRTAVRRFRRRRPLAVVIGSSPLAEYLRRQFAGQATRFDLAAAFACPEDVELDGVDAVFCDADCAPGLWQRLPEMPGGMALYILPEASSAGSAALSVATVEGVPMLALKSACDLAVLRRAKRALDLLVAPLLLLLSSPFWLLCMAGIALSMPGPLFYGHRRMGLFGREFRLLKFRSMVRDADRMAADLTGFDDAYKLKHDPRITPFGRLMRKLSLDELPQLINILRGELSLVGPRPVVADEVAKYGHWGRLLLTVPPGLTGLWQVSGRSDVSYQRRVDFDLYYINNWSLGLDLLILLRTVPAVLSRKGAY